MERTKFKSTSTFIRTKAPAFKRTKKALPKGMQPFTFVAEDAPKGINPFQVQYYDILLGKSLCGCIVEYEWAEPQLGTYRIRFMIRKERTSKDPKPFSWLTIGERFKNAAEARAHVQQYEKQLQNTYNLYLMPI